jgi:hypothetical protein
MIPMCALSPHSGIEISFADGAIEKAPNIFLSRAEFANKDTRVELSINVAILALV